MSYNIYCARNGLVLFLVIASSIYTSDARAQSGGTVKLSVTDARPVAAAVMELVSRYGYLITYEDPRHMYQDDLEDVTSKVRRDLDKYPPGMAPKVIVPSTATLTLNIPSASAITAQDMAAVLAQLMQAQSSTGRGGHFRVQRSGDEFHVLPTEFRDQNGNWIEETSILEVSISMPLEDRSADGMINAICKAVSAAGHVKMGLAFSVGGISSPSNPRPYRFGADNERARDVLMRALNLLGANQSRTWVLFFDPSNLSGYPYVLTIRNVPKRLSTPLATVAPPKTLPNSPGPAVAPPNK
jgi:hypothetical protein